MTNVESPSKMALVITLLITLFVKKMRNLHYILFPLLVCLLANCGKSPSSKTPPPKSPEQVELTIKIQDLEFNIPIELNDLSKGSRSFSENEAVGRNLATNVSYNYVGTIDLEDNYSPGNPIKGHLIAFLISQFDPNSKKTPKKFHLPTIMHPLHPLPMV